VKIFPIIRSLVGLKTLRSAKLAFSSCSKPFCSHYETVILVIIFSPDRQLCSLTYAREIFALSQKLSSTVGATFDEKCNMCNFQPPLYKIWGVPDPQCLYPVIAFIVPVIMQQKFSMQL